MSVRVTLTQWEVDAAEFNTQKLSLLGKEIGIEKRKKLFITLDNRPAHSVARECVLYIRACVSDEASEHPSLGKLQVKLRDDLC